MPPYILDNERELYNSNLHLLLKKLSVQTEEDLGGHLNYCVTYLLNNLFLARRKYVRVNTLRGSVDNAVSEWYRKLAVPYEDEKIKLNGEV